MASRGDSTRTLLQKFQAHHRRPTSRCLCLFNFLSKSLFSAVELHNLRTYRKHSRKHRRNLRPSRRRRPLRPPRRLLFPQSSPRSVHYSREAQSTPIRPLFPAAAHPRSHSRAFSVVETILRGAIRLSLISPATRLNPRPRCTSNSPSAPIAPLSYPAPNMATLPWHLQPHILGNPHCTRGLIQRLRSWQSSSIRGPGSGSKEHG